MTQTRVSKPNVVSDAKPVCKHGGSGRFGVSICMNGASGDPTGVLALGANVGTAVGAYALCDAAFLGPEDFIGDIACAFIAGSAAGAASQGVECASHGGNDCSANAFTRSMLLNGTAGLAGSLTVAVACKIMCTAADGLIPGLFKESDDAPKRAGPDGDSKPAVDGPPLPESARGEAPGLDSAGDIRAAKQAEDHPPKADPAGTHKKAPGGSSTSDPTTTPERGTPTTTKTGGGTGSTDVAAEPTTPVERATSPAGAAPGGVGMGLGSPGDAGGEVPSVLSPTNLLDSGDQLNSLIPKVVTVDGYHDVWIHGSPHGVAPGFNAAESGTNLIDHRALARMIKNDPSYDGGPIRLCSCQTGSARGTFAQDLANKMGVNVLAPNGYLYVWRSGNLSIGPEGSPLNDGWFGGSWIPFRPGGNLG